MTIANVSLLALGYRLQLEVQMEHKYLDIHTLYFYYNSERS